MLKKDRARYIEALKQGLDKWRDYEEHPDKPMRIMANDAICGCMVNERARVGTWKSRCQYCFLYKKRLCGYAEWTSAYPLWLMVFGDKDSPLYGKFPNDKGNWDIRRAKKRGLHYPLFRGVMRRAIEDELRRVEGLART
jgi:hypothetical protein